MRARIAALGFLMVLLVAIVAAQTGSLAGVVEDAGGKALSGVTVEVSSAALIEKVRTTVTDKDGRYRFTALPVGTYEVTFNLSGFATLKRTGVAITSDFTAPVNATMKVGGANTTVNVVAEAPVVDANNARVQQVFQGEEIANLPTQRDIPSMLLLVPGLTSEPTRGTVNGGVGVFANPTAPQFNSHTGALDADGQATGRIMVDGAARPIAPPPVPGTEAYAVVPENLYRRVADEPLSTFSIDVDTASYSNIRRFLNDGRLPPRSAVRVEEMINYFHFDYPQPKGDVPFSITTELSESPWNKRNRLVLVGLQGRAIDAAEPPARNLVFLIDVSGSMSTPEKLPLVRSAMRMLAETLGPRDRVAIVTYAGASGLALPSTPGDQKATIHAAIARLDAGGSTNGGAGIQLAYQMARQQFTPGGVNRVILATDGDFNVGVTSQGELVRMIEQQRESGIFLSVLGVGTGNLKDSTMELLADKGNGNYSYLDSLQEAQRVLVREAGATFVTIAKDVKIQVEFNPQTVSAYRLIGYENRLLQKEDFNDDRKDAGEIGAGHSVTALYEIVPAGAEMPNPAVDPLKYQQAPAAPATPPARAAASQPFASELMSVKLRYKAPDGDTSRLVSAVVINRPQAMTPNVGFASAVAELGMLLRGSTYDTTSSFAAVAARARQFRGSDPDGYRAELAKLADLAGGLQMLDATDARAR